MFLIIASNQTPQNSSPPAAPTLDQLQIPSGNVFASVQPAVYATASAPANYFVLPLESTTAPIVRAILSSPSNSSLAVTATDVGRGGSAVTLPLFTGPFSGPTTGYYQVLGATSGWFIVIRYPNSFQGSKSIRTGITVTVGGATSAPLSFDMSFSGKTVTVSIVTANGDGMVKSNPPGIDCPPTCTADLLGWSSVQLTQSVLHNETEFIGWMGSCGGTGNPCTAQLHAPGNAAIPMNAAVTALFRIHNNASAGVEEITLSRSTDPQDDQFVYVDPLLVFTPQNATVLSVTNVSTDVNGNGVKLELVRHTDANGVSRSLPAANCPAAPLEPLASTSIFNGLTVQGEWKVRAVCISQVFLNDPPARIALQIAWTQP
jgi:hypothetical protein